MTNRVPYLVDTHTFLKWDVRIWESLPNLDKKWVGQFYFFHKINGYRNYKIKIYQCLTDARQQILPIVICGRKVIKIALIHICGRRQLRPWSVGLFSSDHDIIMARIHARNSWKCAIPNLVCITIPVHTIQTEGDHCLHSIIILKNHHYWCEFVSFSHAPDATDRLCSPLLLVKVTDYAKNVSTQCKSVSTRERLCKYPIVPNSLTKCLNSWKFVCFPLHP